MDSRLEGLSQEIKVRGFPGKRETKNGLTNLGSAVKFMGGHALSHQHRISASHADDFTVWSYTCPLERVVCTHREL
jgi:hypothetical protein